MSVHAFYGGTATSRDGEHFVITVTDQDPEATLVGKTPVRLRTAKGREFQCLRCGLTTTNREVYKEASCRFGGYTTVYDGPWLSDP
ncbi:MAG: hypothetical protein HYY50_00380 [Candidatus Kerfeldbacteria bacterium]|nr:hypothetical protein [Candidatus Kerfeldbacteria bacterium]